jgi:hypothetical protein
MANVDRAELAEALSFLCSRANRTKDKGFDKLSPIGRK